MDNYYHKLGVSTKATPEELKNRFEKKIKSYLFFGLSARKIKKIERLKLAFETLIDPAQRNKHDLELGLYPANEQAPWRPFYQNYSNQTLKQDLSFSTELLSELVEKFDGKRIVPGIVFVLFGLLAILILVLFALLDHPETKKSVQIKPVVMQDSFQIFNKEEQEIFKNLTPTEKQDFLITLRQIESLKAASNFPQILNSCKLHLEAVSLAEELIIKYQGLLSCLRDASTVKK